MATSEIEFVRAAYAAFSTRTARDATLRAGFAPDFVWRMRSDFPGRSEYPLDELPLMWKDLDRTLGSFELIPLRFSKSKDRVLVELKAGTLVRGTASHIAERAFHVWRFENGLAIEARTYGDRTEAIEAAGLSKSDGNVSEGTSP